ncbi:hypothetical protein [Actinocorallia herbida]|uniref:hypothetical protein n=1 Tax=Actinocorallia herbida TaxID=58109 RepID=UPI001477239B|nr:hypothetical protein [Actinocorallia herbida]
MADETLTYRDLAARVEEVGLRAGRRLVLLSGTNVVETAVWYLAALAGGHPVLIGGVTHAEALGEIHDPDVLVPGDGTTVHRRAEGRHDLHPELALLLSTSGSTGSPKPVRLSHDSLRADADSIASHPENSPDDRAITTPAPRRSRTVRCTARKMFPRFHGLAGAEIGLGGRAVVSNWTASMNRTVWTP